MLTLSYLRTERRTVIGIFKAYRNHAILNVYAIYVKKTVQFIYTVRVTSWLYSRYKTAQSTI